MSGSYFRQSCLYPLCHFLDHMFVTRVMFPLIVYLLIIVSLYCERKVDQAEQKHVSRFSDNIFVGRFNFTAFFFFFLYLLIEFFLRRERTINMKAKQIHQFKTETNSHEHRWKSQCVFQLFSLVILKFRGECVKFSIVSLPPHHRFSLTCLPLACIPALLC